MPHPHLDTYLNNHLAGSAAGLELLEFIASAYEGTEVEKVAKRLHQEVTEDQKELEKLISQLQITQDIKRKAMGWLTEKFTEAKLRIDDTAGGSFRLHEACEAMSLGVEGKRLLWIALAASAETNPSLRNRDYANLIRRAESQRERLERIRVSAAREALSGSGS